MLHNHQGVLVPVILGRVLAASLRTPTSFGLHFRAYALCEGKRLGVRLGQVELLRDSIMA